MGYAKYPNDEKVIAIKKKLLDKIIFESNFNDLKKYEIRIVHPNKKVMDKPIIITYDKNEIDKNLLNKESNDLLFFYSLKLPSEYKDKSLKELQKALKKSQEVFSTFKDKIKNVANFDYFEGKRIARPKNKNPSAKTLENIADHNILEIYNYNLNQLREFKEKTGTGILHFSNPHQLLDRLELLGGSVLAGNNGVI